MSNIKSEIYREMRRIGCCKRCCLRYIEEAKFCTFSAPDVCLQTFGILDSREKDEETAVCVICLGLTQDNMLMKICSDQRLNLGLKYKHESFILHISIPLCMYLRERSVQIHLFEKFPNFHREDVNTIKLAWRQSISERLMEKLQKKVDTTSKLSVHLGVDYISDPEESSAIQKGLEITSKICKSDLRLAMEGITDDQFKNLKVAIPPKNVSDQVIIRDIHWRIDSVNLIGNYNKISANLFQLPLTDKKQTIVRYSLQNIILWNIERVIGCDESQMIFKVSSHDDRNHRVFGTGRLFSVEILNPTFPEISAEQCRRIEQAVNRHEIVTIKNLREIYKKDIPVMFDAQQREPKTYKLLCYVFDKSSERCVNAINMYRSFEVEQKMPVKFLNYRPNTNKKKKIFSIKARTVQNRVNLIEVDFVAEGGLHVPDFVHGDFKRTKPSLSSITNAGIELITMDILEFGTALPMETD